MTLSGSGRQGLLALPPGRAQGLIVFAHGSSRFSPRNAYVAQSLQQAGFATLLFDLLAEPEAADRSNIFNIPLLAQRLDMAATAGRLAAANLQLPLGFFFAPAPVPPRPWPLPRFAPMSPPSSAAAVARIWPVRR